MDVSNLSENISEIIENIEKELDFSFENIIINYPFGDLFIGSKSISYKRKVTDQKITPAELSEILKDVEKLCIKSMMQDVAKYFGHKQSETSIIFSRISSVESGGEEIKKILGTSHSKLQVSIINGCVPKDTYLLLSRIIKSTGKHLSHILPVEYCISKIFTHRNVLIINLGATQTTVTLKKDGDVLGVSKFSVGMHNLITKICKSEKKSQSEVIHNLETDIYKKYKDSFLSAWGESLGITIKELLGERTCPKEMYLGGGGGNNDFIKKYLTEIPYASFGIRHLGETEFVNEDVSEILKHMKNISIEDIKKIPLEIYVLLLETRDILHKEHDTLSITLRKVINELSTIKK